MQAAELLCTKGCRGVRVGSRALCAFENIGVTMFCLLCFPQDTWQRMLPAAGSNVCYLRGTTGEHFPAAVVGLLSFLECFAISYECSDHMQLY